MIDPVRDFAAAATAFCAWCAGPVGEPQAELRAAQRHLALLYALALRLDPDVGADDVTPDADGSRCDEERWRTVYRRAGVLPVGYYAEVLDVQRLIDPPTGIGDVGDDIADVYRDLEEGLGLYRDTGRDLLYRMYRSVC